MLRSLSSVLSDLEVRLLQDSDELVGCLAPVRDRDELLEDVLDKLHVVLPHSFQFGFFKRLVSLQFNEYNDRLSLQPVHHTELKKTHLH